MRAEPKATTWLCPTPDARVEAAPIAELQISMSFGMAAHEPGTFDFETVFAAADLALYDAKAQGRNRVCRAPAGDAAQTTCAA